MPEKSHRAEYRQDLIVAHLVGLAGLALYLVTLAPGVLPGDSGEFQFAAWLAGFVHPTGYPLYLVLGWLWSHLLPLGNPAWRMNAFSAVWGAATLALVYLLAVSVLRQAWPILGPRYRRVLALVAPLTLGAGATYWSQATAAEVYTLHAFLTAGVLLGIAIWSGRPARTTGYRPLYWAALLFGLGMAHHRSIVLLLPGIALFLLEGRRRSETWRTRIGGLVRALPLVLLPLLFYLYIPLRAPAAPYYRLPLSESETLTLIDTSFSGFVTYVLGQTFSSQLRSGPAALEQIVPAAAMIARELTVPGLALALLGAVALRRSSVRPLFTLTAVSAVALLVFNLFYGIGDIKVFYIPLYLIASVWIAVGLAGIMIWLARILRAPGALPNSIPLPARLVVALLLVAVPAVLLASNLRISDRSHEDGAARQWESILNGNPPADAILVSNDRDEMTPLWYYQYVEGKRRDIAGLFPQIGPIERWGNVGQVLDGGLRTRRPVLLLKPMQGLDVKFRIDYGGALPRVVGPAVEKAPDKTLNILFGEAVRLNGYDARPSQVRASSSLTVSLYWQPVRQLNSDYTTFVHLLNASGDVVARSDKLPGGLYYPTSKWRAGELLKDNHVLALPADLGPAPYTVLAGLYVNRNGLQHLGRPEGIGRLSPERPPDRLPEDAASRLDFVMDGEMALNGRVISVTGSELRVRLYWQALRSPTRDYTMFLHVVAANGNIVAQRDQQPAEGKMPAGSWPKGYIFADDMVIQLPADLPAGQYSLMAGLYDPATISPLPVTDGAGRPFGTRAPIGSITWPAQP